jgi:hypothetical protein
VMIYASNTGTKRNLAALRDAGFRILVTPEKPKPPFGFKYAVDNGAWKAHQQQMPFDSAAFARLVDQCGSAADFVVVPDIVAGGRKSLDFSVSWIPQLSGLRLLLPVQDGMHFWEVGDVLREFPTLGIFLGGSTEWKLKTMYAWGMMAHGAGRYYHVGRVNTARRIRLAAESGADSVDGTSASKYSCTVPLLDAARSQPSLLTPSVEMRCR